MAAALLRRSLVTATVAGLAMAGAPLLGTAFAATLGAPTYSPSGSTAKANRPAFTATYNVPLSGSSTASLTDTSNSNAGVACATGVSGASISCTPDSGLTDGHTYKLSVHAVNGDGSGNARDDSNSWTVDIPSLKSSSPKDGDVVASGNISVSATYDEAIDTSASTITLTNVNGNAASGTTSFSASSLGGPTDTIKLTPSRTPLPTGSYVVHVHAQANGNKAAFADSVINFTVNSNPPPAAPVVSTAGFSRNGTTHFINGGNQKSVPFAGTAPPNFRVGVLVYDKSTPGGLPPAVGSGPNDKGANTAVADCGSSMCPWQLTVDTTNTPDKAYQYYVYTYSSNGVKLPAQLDQNADPTITKDTGAPAPGQNATGSLPSASNTLTVTDQDPDPSVTFWNVVVTDSVGGTVEKDNVPAASTSSRDLNTTIDVSPLADGDLTVDTFASDDAGNLSSADEPSPLNAPNAKETVTTAVDVANSFVTVNGTNLTFPQIAGRTIALPSSVTVRFNEPVRLKVTNSAPPNSPTSPATIFAADVCVADSTGFCIGQPVALTKDQMGLVVDTSGGATPKSGSYSIVGVKAPAATTGSCPNESATNASTYNFSNCERVDTTKAIGGTDPVVSFAVDNVAPNVAFTGFSPNPVNGPSASQVAITGTADADTATVQLVIKSSGGGSPKLVNVPVTPPSDPSATSVGWTASPVDLTTVIDGTLTVSATATDQAGNTTATPVVLSPAPVLKAHLSWLTELTSNRIVTYGKLIRLHGRLTDNSGAGIAGATLTIRPRFDNKKFGRAVTTTTDGKGYWSRLIAPAHNATYWARYAGSTATGALHDAVTTHTARTRVRVRMLWISPKNGARVGAPVVLKGSVSPNKHGRYVYFYRHTSTRNFLLGRVRLGTGSRWAFRVTLPRGTSLVFVKIGNTFGNLGNRTTYRKLVR